MVHTHLILKLICSMTLIFDPEGQGHILFLMDNCVCEHAKFYCLQKLTV